MKKHLSLFLTLFCFCYLNSSQAQNFNQFDTGDWYFTGNYPTPGGNKVVNKAFINFIEGRNERAY